RTWGAQDQTAEQPGDPSALCLTDDYACAGMDTYGEHVEPVRHRVGVDVDVDRFWDLLVDALTRIGNTGFRGSRGRAAWSYAHTFFMLCRVVGRFWANFRPQPLQNAH